MWTRVGMAPCDGTVRPSDSVRSWVGSGSGFGAAAGAAGTGGVVTGYPLAWMEARFCGPAIGAT